MQLAFENANNDCKTVLQPIWLATTDVGQFIKACQNVGAGEHRAALLAAALKGEIDVSIVARLDTLGGSVVVKIRNLL